MRLRFSVLVTAAAEWLSVSNGGSTNPDQSSQFPDLFFLTQVNLVEDPLYPPCFEHVLCCLVLCPGCATAFRVQKVSVVRTRAPSC